MTTKDRADMIASPKDLPSETDSDLLMGLRELRRFQVADGYVVMAEQRGRIGFAAVGPKAWETLNALMFAHHLSPLETYQVLGGDPAKAPAWLVGDHAVRHLGNPAAQKGRPLPALDEIVSASHPVLALSQNVGTIAGAACVSGPVPCLDYFESYFYSYSAMYNNNVSWANMGANGITGSGTWQNGNADLNLGPTSAGVAVVCFCSNQGYAIGPRLTVQEYLGQAVWMDLWSAPSLFTGAGYGIIFRGFGIRRIRLLIRGNQDNVGNPFSWGGSF